MRQRARARTIQYAPKNATVAVTATLPHHFNSAANLALNVEFTEPGKSSLVGPDAGVCRCAGS
jgi:hypothetical protein